MDMAKYMVFGFYPILNFTELEKVMDFRKQLSVIWLKNTKDWPGDNIRLWALTVIDLLFPRAGRELREYQCYRESSSTSSSREKSSRLWFKLKSRRSNKSNLVQLRASSEIERKISKFRLPNSYFQWGNKSLWGKFFRNTEQRDHGDP